MSPVILIKSKPEAQSLIDIDKAGSIKKMISIGHPGDTPPNNYVKVEDVLRCEFWDTDRLLGEIDPPSEQDVFKIIEFAKKISVEECGGVLLIHSHAGKSRSPAAAFICLCVWSEPGDEEANLSTVYAWSSRSKPNMAMIEHADRLLDRNGEMVRVLKQRPAAVPW